MSGDKALSAPYSFEYQGGLVTIFERGKDPIEIRTVARFNLVHEWYLQSHGSEHFAAKIRKFNGEEVP